MPMMTGEQYEASLRKLDLVVYLFGKRVENPVDDPVIRPSLNAVKLTYDLAHEPAYEDIMCAGSPLAQRIMIGRQVDLEARKKLARHLCGIDDA